MAVHRLFIIWTHRLFRESVRLILDHPDVVWVGATSDYMTAKDEIATLRPDTVLIEEAVDSRPGAVLEILKACPDNALVVGLSLDDNKLSIYQHREQVVGKADDLLGLLLNEPS